jgi:hypothetical protein
MSDFGTSSKYNVRNGFLVRKEQPSDFAPRTRALDAYRRPFSPDDEEEPEMETHNQGEGEEGEEVARYPAGSFTVLTEDDDSGEPHHVVYRSGGEGRAPSGKTDIYEMSDNRARDAGSRAPRTLAQLNAANAAFYKAKGGRR